MEQKEKKARGQKRIRRGLERPDEVETKNCELLPMLVALDLSVALGTLGRC